MAESVPVPELVDLPDELIGAAVDACPVPSLVLSSNSCPPRASRLVNLLTATLDRDRNP
jgi:hypothetical protein